MAIECLLVAVIAVVGLINPPHVGVAIGMGVLYLASATGLVLAAIGLWERRSWGRAPVVVAQLIILGVAWDIREDAIAAAIGGGVLALAVLMCVLHPASTRVLSDVS